MSSQSKKEKLLVVVRESPTYMLLHHCVRLFSSHYAVISSLVLHSLDVLFLYTMAKSKNKYLILRSAYGDFSIPPSVCFPYA